MNYDEFRLTALPCGDRAGVFGPHAINELPDYIQEHGFTRIFLLTGQVSFQKSGAMQMMPSLGRSAEILSWSDFRVNPSVSDLHRGIAVLNEFQPDLVIGIGGGTVMDMAKLLIAFSNSTLPLSDLETAVANNNFTQARPPHLVLVPTTAGSGSEATHFAVAYIGTTKCSVASRSLYADFVVLDTALMVSGSPYQKATSGIDAVCQAMESIWAVASSPESRLFAVHALNQLIPALPPWVSGDTTVSPEMTAGSYLAGRAIDLSKTTGPHAMSYALTQQYGVSHGHAVAMTFRAFVEAHATAQPEKLQPEVTAETHASAIQTLTHALGLNHPTDIAGWFEEYCGSLGLNLSLSRYGITDNSMESIALSINAERLNNNPLVMKTGDLVEILRASR